MRRGNNDRENLGSFLTRNTKDRSGGEAHSAKRDLKVKFH